MAAIFHRINSGDIARYHYCGDITYNLKTRNAN